MRKVRELTRGGPGALALWVTVSLAPAPASARTYLVLPDGTGDYATIQAAMDHAVDGDEILLGDGTFRGEGNRDVDCDGAITIRSVHGDPAACVIDCEGSAMERHHGFWLWGSALIGVTVTHGYDGDGGGVRLWEGGIVSRCIFLENHATRWGGAVMCDMTYEPIVSECTFIRNSAEYGGGAFI
jgi:hypothetical protein